MTAVIDIWVNLLSPEFASKWSAGQATTGMTDFLGSELASASDPEALVSLMDECEVDVAVLAAALRERGDAEAKLAIAEKHGGRFVVAGIVDRPDKPTFNMQRIRELAQHPLFSMVRVTPLATGTPLNAAVFYPVYAACSEVALPVGINVGIPGPRVRSASQHPQLLEDVLIDFPDLIVIGAHMGHPYESLLMQYMLKWPNLYLSNTAYSAKYMDPALVAFMGSKRGHGRVLFGSDHPFLPMRKAIEAAHGIDLRDEAKNEFLGGAACRLLRLETP